MINKDKLGALVGKIANQYGVRHQALYDMFFFEGFLRRISLSKYRENFVMKGGFLLESIIGVSKRTTMDVDLKAQGIELEEREMERILQQIAATPAEDGISYRILELSNITAEMKYPGKSARIEGRFENLKKSFSIDIARGDIVTPYPQKYEYRSILGGATFDILAYNMETIAAEKLVATISRGADNSRSKDLFDIKILMNEGLDKERINAAVINTFWNHDIILDKRSAKNILEATLASPKKRMFYEGFSRKNSFAKDMGYEDAAKSVMDLLDLIDGFDPILPEKGTKISLIRHGEDEKKKLGGWSYSSLTEKGIEQMKDLAERMDHDYDLIVSSDLPRARQSAEILAKKLDCPIVYEEGLRETNNGIYKDMSLEEFGKTGAKRFIDMGMNEEYPGGESPASFFRRAKETYEGIIEKYKGRKIAVITHGGTITAFLCLVHGWRYSNLLQIAPSYGSIIEIS